MPSKVAYDPEQPSLGRIRADSIVPPHSPITIKRCISRVERTPAIALADLFADITCNTPLKDDHIPILRAGCTDCPGLSPKNPMAIVQNPVVIVQNPVAIVEKRSIPDGRYVIKNRAADIVWNAGWNKSIGSVYFGPATIERATESNCFNTQVNKYSLIAQVLRE